MENKINAERNEIKHTAHSTYRCQYHIVFAPKFRRKEIYGKLRKDIGEILRKLCEQKKVEIIEAQACPDHIHMLVSIPPYLSVSQFMGYADIFVPMLDRMYHKRIRGYAELGYVLNGSLQAETSLVYGSSNFFNKYSDDINNADKEVIISAPTVKPGYLKRIVPLISETVKLIIIVSELDENEMLENVEYIIQDKSHQTFTVIDNQIVWCGNVNPLSYNLAESSVLRLINASLAGKLTKGVMVDPTLFD